ncbi:MAG: hypothetical protein RL444_1820 [Verrucomicrobiota bacterium]|jgi:hypothetical protein
MLSHSHLLMNHRIKQFLVAAAVLGCAHTASAAERNPALDLLVKKGIITAEERAQALEQAAIANLRSGPKEIAWYDKLKIDGYTQFRFTENLDDASKALNVPADKSVSTTEGFLLRRGRFKISGDVAPRLHVYSQLDFAASTGATSLSLQARDLYADIALDDDREHRVRAGLSKVPYGWVNLQSSQNRIVMERPEALNSAVEGERDLGLYYMYASKESRELFKSLVKDGLKGSGDYGVLTLGGFAGQGLNKSDLNGEPHLLARLSYPWKTESGQIYEAGIGAYAGKYVVATGTTTRVDTGASVTPAAGSKEFDDRRAVATFIMYPQPFGIEAEWTVGQGPQLNANRDAIGLADLKGGYVLINYRIFSGEQEFFPFVRWNYFDGARKFATNAPKMVVNEIDIGCEWQIRKELELQASYTFTNERNNTSASPYTNVKDARRFAIQLQFNY